LARNAAGKAACPVFTSGGASSALDEYVMKQMVASWHQTSAQ